VLGSTDSKQMDRETGDGIKRHFDEVAEGLRAEMLAEMRALSEGLRAEMGGLADGLRAEMGGLADGLRAEMGGLRAEIRDGKRHSDVVAESLRSEIRLVAEGVAGLDQKFTMEFVNVREEIGDVKSLLQVSYGDLGRRVQALEGKPSSA
jgi:hypothetical protein